MYIKILCLILILIGCFVLVACEFPQDYVNLMKLPKEERLAEYKKLPLEKQFEFYVLRATYSHPSDRDFANYIAMRGEAALPYLLKQLEGETQDYRKEQIIWLFRQIHVNTVDLRNKQEIIDSMEKAVTQMNDPDWKNMSQRTVQFIKEFSPKHTIPNLR